MDKETLEFEKDGMELDSFSDLELDFGDEMKLGNLSDIELDFEDETDEITFNPKDRFDKEVGIYIDFAAMTPFDILLGEPQEIKSYIIKHLDLNLYVYQENLQNFDLYINSFYKETLKNLDNVITEVMWAETHLPAETPKDVVEDKFKDSKAFSDVLLERYKEDIMEKVTDLYLKWTNNFQEINNFIESLKHENIDIMNNPNPDNNALETIQSLEFGNKFLMFINSKNNETDNKLKTIESYMKIVSAIIQNPNIATTTSIKKDIDRETIIISKHLGFPHKLIEPINENSSLRKIDLLDKLVVKKDNKKTNIPVPDYVNIQVANKYYVLVNNLESITDNPKLLFGGM